MNHYISDHPNFTHPSLLDVPQTPVQADHLKSLVDGGIPTRLALHFARLFSHDALVIYKGYTEVEEEGTQHFEQFQSTNWNSIRFKPPPTFNSDIGWRVEF
jgi:glutamate--cysteine ligase catalytic subunit